LRIVDGVAIKMNTMKNINVLLLGVVIFFFACGKDEASQHQDETPVVDEQITENVIIEESSDFAFAPPSPLEIAAFFKQAGLVYDQTILNPVSNKDLYQTKLKKSLNFGVYAADLATCVVNDQISDAKGYLEATEYLANEIGMSNIFEETAMTKFKENISNTDSIIMILTEIQMNTIEYIELNGKDDLEVVYFAGAWIEGMYLGSLTIMEQDSGNVVQQLASQIEFGNRIATGLEVIEDQDPEIIYIRNGILEIVNAYQNCESIKNLTDEDVDLGRLQMTKAELKEISELIVALRNDMIE
jgi:hypothetical protein